MTLDHLDCKRCGHPDMEHKDGKGKCVSWEVTLGGLVPCECEGLILD